VTLELIIGFYEPLRKSFNQVFGIQPDEQRLLTSVTAGAFTGMIGGRSLVTGSKANGLAGLGSPLFLVKARIQAYSPAFPVGAQHYYKNSFDALTTIMKSDGVRGLWRGVNAAFLRTAMVGRLLLTPQTVLLACTYSQGSSVQLPSYGWAKGLLVEQGWAADGFATFLSASAVSGVAVVSDHLHFVDRY
jgi:solute carrier family 25 protein 34/35